MTLSSSELEELKTAKYLLENPGLAAKISNAIGTPIEKGIDKLPDKWNQTINGASMKSVEAALDMALWTMDSSKIKPPSNWWHKLAAGTTGGAGGAFGLPALAIELPISTTIILRSIADIARSEGENLQSPEAKLQCVQVLALGGSSESDDGVETGYFTTRAALAKSVSEAATYVAKYGLADAGAPALVRFIKMIASRFSIVVTEKATAQAVPVVGAVGGAVINTLFMDHFQNMGKGHFVVRRLERVHGVETVKRVYEQL